MKLRWNSELLIHPTLANRNLLKDRQHVFHINRQNYQTSFLESIHFNNEDIPNIEQLTVLLTQLRSETAESVSSIQISDKNYPILVDILNWFDNPRKRNEELLQKISDNPLTKHKQHKARDQYTCMKANSRFKFVMIPQRSEDLKDTEISHRFTPDNPAKEKVKPNNDAKQNSATVLSLSCSWRKPFPCCGEENIQKISRCSR